MARGFLRALPALLLAAVAAAQPGTFSIHSIKVEGDTRFPAAAILRAAGLRTGAATSARELEDACNRLVATGILESAQYRYTVVSSAPRAADVTLTVTDQPLTEPAKIRIPGIDEAQAWRWLAENEPLVTPDVPTNDQAVAFYTAAIERFLEAQGRAEKVGARRSAGVIGVDQSATVFGPAALQKIAAVRFEGAKAIPAADLEKAAGPRTLGHEYVEDDFREALGPVLRLYEKLGYLNVRFPKITAEPDGSGGIVVTAEVEEGMVYRIRRFEIAGEGLPPLDPQEVIELKRGDVANWQEVLINRSHIELALKRYGYLQAKGEVERRLDDAAAAVDVKVTVAKGVQYRLGGLKIQGLDPVLEARARALWKLSMGEPVNTDYFREFQGEVAKDARLRLFELRVGVAYIDTDKVAVVLTFGGGR